MNLIKDQWIPARRADGTECTIAPWEIGASENPVIDIAAPRPDFRGALYQFLIGLVQTMFAPADDDEWEKRWNEIPTCEELKNAFGKYADAFELVNENGPAFMQDYSIADENNLPIEDIVGGSLSTNTREKNHDLFVKRGGFSVLSPYWAALALFNVQTSAVPQWGQHRVGLRPTGPITTLLVPEEIESFFLKIYINILTVEDLSEVPGDKEKKNIDDIFPWMGPIRYSPNKEQTTPMDCNPLQHYWPLPRRLKLLINTIPCICDMDGRKVCQSVSEYKRQIDGVLYQGGWIHPLTPYEKKQNLDFPNALTGEQLQYSYKLWLPLTLGVGDYYAAKIVEKYFRCRFMLCETHLWAFGYYAVNAELKAWYEYAMPVISLPTKQKQTFIDDIKIALEAVNDVIKKLEENVKFAWVAKWDNNKKKFTVKDFKGDTTFIHTAFYELTENSFFEIAEKLRAAIGTDQPTNTILSEWCDIIIDSAERLFDRFALQNTDDIKNMKRIAEAAKALSGILRSTKTKTIQALLQ